MAEWLIKSLLFVIMNRYLHGEQRDKKKNNDLLVYSLFMPADWNADMLIAGALITRY